MLDARPESASQLDFVQIADFSSHDVFRDAVKDVDSIIHVASVSLRAFSDPEHDWFSMNLDILLTPRKPFSYSVGDNEKELVLPAINGVKAILNAAKSQPSIKRVVVTSSFASVLDVSKPVGPGFTYTGKDWNPLTYEESVDPKTSAVVAYRGSKKFAELAAWEFVEKEKPGFDIVTLCPPMSRRCCGRRRAVRDMCPLRRKSSPMKLRQRL